MEGPRGAAGTVLPGVLLELVMLVSLHTAAQCANVSVDNLVHCKTKQTLSKFETNLEIISEG